MNKMMIIGNLTRDPELRYTKDGKPVCNFDVAVNGRKDGQQDVTYFRVAAWNKLAESCKEYLVKGRKVFVSGPVSVSPWERDGTLHADLNVTAQEVEFLSPAGEKAPVSHGDPRFQHAPEEQQATMFPEFTKVETDELPF